MNAMMSNRWGKGDVQTFLMRGRWFGSLPASLQEAILAPCEIQRYQANTTVYKLGDSVDGLYAVLEGDVRSYAHDDDGERAFFRPVGPGSWFGNVPLLSGAPWRTLEIRAVSPATLLFLPEQPYREMTERDPELYRAFVQLTCKHLHNATRILLEFRSEAPRRTARAFLRLAHAHGVPTNEGTRLAMNLSQADLASLVGVSRQYMNELIARWEGEGVLRWNGKAQPLLDMERLRSLLSPLDSWMEEYEDWI
jgi:CRP/FNR family transcriptional regulator, cyclic AMP receptor protein